MTADEAVRLETMARTLSASGVYRVAGPAEPAGWAAPNPDLETSLKNDWEA
jgi:hypothetical protein